jgi:hypothetical protein
MIPLYDGSYELYVDPKIIITKENKFHGNREEVPTTHLDIVLELVSLFGKDVFKQQCVFLKL